MAKKYLQQVTTGEIYVWTPELAQRSDMRPYTGQRQENEVLPPRIQSDVIRFYLSARGVGDCIVGAYVACGLANAGHQVEFFTPHHEWLRFDHPGVSILPGEEGLDANLNYHLQLKDCRVGDMSRADWYIKNIATAYEIKPCKPARPSNLSIPRRLIPEEYVLLCPFSHANSRMWLTEHYRRLAKMLIEAGQKVAVMASQKHGDLCSDTFYGLDVELFVDVSPLVAISVIAHAKHVVTNDSGPAHVAGLYGQRATVLLAQFRPEYLFPCAENLTPILASANCVKCHEQVEAGWDRGCGEMCSALQTISPEKVFGVVLDPADEIRRMAKTALFKKPGPKPKGK